MTHLLPLCAPVSKRESADATRTRQVASGATRSVRRSEDEERAARSLRLCDGLAVRRRARPALGRGLRRHVRRVLGAVTRDEGQPAVQHAAPTRERDGGAQGCARVTEGAHAVNMGQ